MFRPLYYDILTYCSEYDHWTLILATLGVDSGPHVLYQFALTDVPCPVSHDLDLSIHNHLSRYPVGDIRVGQVSHPFNSIFVSQPIT